MNSARFNDLEKLEAALDIKITKKELLDRSLTHSSWINEKGLPRNFCYENLEFFGDSILSFVVSEFLFNNSKENEGILSKKRAILVCEDSLYKIALRYGLENYIKTGGAVTRIDNQLPKSIIADCVEAIIATIYIDSGMDEARKFIIRQMNFLIVDEEVFKTQNNEPKSRLQEYVQKKFKILPEYRLKSHVKLDHDNLEIFHVMIYIKNKFISVGSGKNHKLAEKNAAENALEFLKTHHDIELILQEEG